MGSRVLGVLIAFAFMAATVALSGVRSVVDDSGKARVRLSWRAVGEPVEECRPPTPEELAALPVHMRQREICDRHLLPFRLDVRIDGETIISREVHASGAREDRPAYVFEEIPLPPGRHGLSISFRVASETSTAAPLDLREDVELTAGEVVLVTRDDDTDQLDLARRRP